MKVKAILEPQYPDPSCAAEVPAPSPVNNGKWGADYLGSCNENRR